MIGSVEVFRMVLYLQRLAGFWYVEYGSDSSTTTDEE
jgi:hypothetical protein